jgi:Tfp pilus assembly protein PilO
MSDNLVQMPRAASTTQKPAAPLRPAPIEGRAQRMGQRVTREWIPAIGWQIRRTGRGGLIGIGLIATAAVFLMSTHWPLVTQVQTMQDDLQAALATAAKSANKVVTVANDDPRHLLDSLPDRAEVPKILGVILAQADAAGLSLETGKYDVAATHTGAVTRYHIGFPVTGAYPAIRTFIDSVLKEVPTASISELAIERKNIADGTVEANIRLTLFTRGAP